MNIYSIAHSALVTMILDTTTSSINDPNKLLPLSVWPPPCMQQQPVRWYQCFRYLTISSLRHELSCKVLHIAPVLAGLVCWSCA